jgi:chromosome partitioning protein
MQVVVMAAQKGGAGKTTLAFHIAVAAEAAGAGPVVLIDTDPQATLTQWWKKRDGEVPKMASADIGTLQSTLAELKAAGFALAIVDTAGRSNEANRSIIQQADLVVMPVKPSAGDLWALTATVETCKTAGRPFTFVVSQAVRGASLTVQAVSALSEHGVVAPVVIHNRVGYAAAMGLGQTIQEVEPKGPGAAEIAGLWEFVQKRMLSGVQTDKRASQKIASRKKELVHG